MNRANSLPLLCALICICGCGRAGAPSSPAASASDRLGLAQHNFHDTYAATPALALETAGAAANTGAQIDNSAPPKSGDDANAAARRKIIYNGSVALVVDDFTKADTRITELADEHGGFISEFREDRTYGEQRAGHWSIRVPIDRFTQFMDKIVELGVAEARQVNAQDVTEEYVDLEARLVNQRRIEERLLTLLAEKAGELKDVIELEVKLGEVREQIERMEGRLRYLTDRVTLATLTISAREERNYTPPQAPTFTAQIGASFFNSLEGLKLFGQQLVLAVVAAAPWLVVGLIVFGPLGILWRRRRSRA